MNEIQTLRHGATYFVGSRAFTITRDFRSTSMLSEPGTIMLMGLGLVGVTLLAKS